MRKPSPTRTADRHSNDSVPLLLRLPKDLHSQLAERAHNEDRHMSGLVRVALREYLGRTA